jgi:hypothetical protein
MDPRPPFPASRVDPGFGPFDCDAIRLENNRRAAGETFSCVACQIAIVLAACASLAFAFMLSWQKLAIYEAQLAACAGV